MHSSPLAVTHLNFQFKKTKNFPTNEQLKPFRILDNRSAFTF